MIDQELVLRLPINEEDVNLPSSTNGFLQYQMKEDTRILTSRKRNAYALKFVECPRNPLPCSLVNVALEIALRLTFRG
jgi:hypothetical protein